MSDIADCRAMDYCAADARKLTPETVRSGRASGRWRELGHNQDCWRCPAEKCSAADALDRWLLGQNYRGDSRSKQQG